MLRLFTSCCGDDGERDDRIDKQQLNTAGAGSSAPVIDRLLRQRHHLEDVPLQRHELGALALGEIDAEHVLVENLRDTPEIFAEIAAEIVVGCAT